MTSSWGTEKAAGGGYPPSVRTAPKPVVGNPPSLLMGLLVVALVAAACSGGDGRPEAGPSRPPAASSVPSPTIAERMPLTEPTRLVIDNLATGPHRRLVKQAIADLRSVGLWRRLTGELFVVEASARPGRRFVPEDGHLADAFRTLDIRGSQGGVLCDITFYPRAMADDLVRWRSFFERGLIAEAPPSRRHLWASVLAHELAHCFKRDNGETDAQRWEARALERLREAGIGD